MKVYIVSNGAYSDYEICAVSCDKEKAQRIKDYIHASNDIEEYDTDWFDRFADGDDLFDVKLDNEGNPVMSYKIDRNPWILEETTRFQKYDDCFVGKDIAAKDENEAIEICRERFNGKQAQSTHL